MGFPLYGSLHSSREELMNDKLKGHLSISEL